MNNFCFYFIKKIPAAVLILLPEQQKQASGIRHVAQVCACVSCPVRSSCQSELNPMSQITLFECWMWPHTFGQQCSRDGLHVCVGVIPWFLLICSERICWYGTPSPSTDQHSEMHGKMLKNAFLTIKTKPKDIGFYKEIRFSHTYPMSDTICSTICLLKVMITKSFCGGKDIN